MYEESEAQERLNNVLTIIKWISGGAGREQ